MRKSLDEIRTSDERQLRPYVGIRMEGATLFNGDKWVEVKFICTNYGKSPAVRLGWRLEHISGGFIEPGMDGNYSFSEIGGDFKDKTRVTIFPESKTNTREITEYLAVNCEWIRSSRDGAVMVGIEVEYFDVFRKENRYTTREYFMLGHTKEPVLMPGGSRIT